MINSTRTIYGSKLAFINLREALQYHILFPSFPLLGIDFRRKFYESRFAGKLCRKPSMRIDNKRPPKRI